MKIILLSLIAALFTSCGSPEQGATTIPESRARFLRKSNLDLILITNKNDLETSDYLLFQKDSSENISVKDLNTESESPYAVVSTAKCKIFDKTITHTVFIKQNIFQLQSILPIELFLQSIPETNCDFEITLQNGESTKTFNFMGATIKNKSSNPQNIFGDTKGNSVPTPKQFSAKINFDSVTVLLKKNDSASLICDDFITEPLELASRFLIFRELAVDANIIYNPYNKGNPKLNVPLQNCIVYMKKENGTVILSPIFKISYFIDGI